MEPEDTPGAISAPQSSMLEKKTADLKAKIEAARLQKAQEEEAATKAAAEAEAKAAEQKEAGIVEGVKQMETGWQEGVALEAEIAKLKTETAVVKKQAQEFQALIEQAKKLDPPIEVEEDAAFMAALQANENKLAALEQRQGELQAGIKERATANPEVIERIQEEADVENQKSPEERESERLATEATTGVSNLFSSIMDKVPLEKYGLTAEDSQQIEEIRVKINDIFAEAVISSVNKSGFIDRVNKWVPDLINKGLDNKEIAARGDIYRYFVEPLIKEFGRVLEQGEERRKLEEYFTHRQQVIKSQ